MNTTTTGATAGYLAEVRAELADLPATERDDVLDDVAGHLDEIARELDTAGSEVTADSLTARLGTPQQYAEELRTAAGYPPKSAAGRTDGRPLAALLLVAVSVVLLPICAASWAGSYSGVGGALARGAAGLAPAMLGLWLLRGHDPREVTETSLWRAVAARSDRLAGLLPAGLRRDLVAVGQPGWWLIRGAIGGGALALLLGQRGPVAVAVAAVAGMVWSVALARLSQRNRRWLWLLMPANALALAALIAGAIWAISDARDDTSRYPAPTATASAAGGLRVNGRMVSNVFPFDQQGRPLKHVRLYDGTGRPLNLRSERCAGTATTWVEDNVFPKPAATLTVDRSSCTETATPPLVVPPLTPAR